MRAFFMRTQNTYAGCPILARFFSRKGGKAQHYLRIGFIPVAEIKPSEGDGGFNPRVNPANFTRALAPDGNLDTLKGHDFSRALRGTESESALAAEGCSWRTSAPDRKLDSMKGTGFGPYIGLAKIPRASALGAFLVQTEIRPALPIVATP